MSHKPLIESPKHASIKTLFLFDLGFSTCSPNFSLPHSDSDSPDPPVKQRPKLSIRILKAHHILCALTSAITCATSAYSQVTYETAANPFDFWGEVHMAAGSSSPVIATDFGIRGTGTVSLHGFSSSAGAILGPGTSILAGSYSLDGGDSLTVGQSILAGDTSPRPDGFTASLGPSIVSGSTYPLSATLTISLDSGEFQAGDLLIVSSLARQNSTSGALVLGSMFDAPLSGDPFIPQGGTNPYTSIGVWGTDASGNPIYVAGEDPGVPLGYMYRSGGEVFRLNQNTDTLSFTLMLGDFGTDGEDGTGITPLSLQYHNFAFTVATPVPVPEPSGALLVAFSAGLLMLRRRRR